MARAYSKRFALRWLTGGWTTDTLYTVPAGKLAIVRSITMRNDNASANRGNVIVQASTGTSPYLVGSDSIAGGGGSQQWHGLHLVLQEGEVLQANAQLATLCLGVHGYELDA